MLEKLIIRADETIGKRIKDIDGPEWEKYYSPENPKAALAAAGRR